MTSSSSRPARQAAASASSATAAQCSRSQGVFRPVIAAIVAKPASIASPWSQTGGEGSIASAYSHIRESSSSPSIVVEVRDRELCQARLIGGAGALLEHRTRALGAGGGEEQRGVLGDVQQADRHRDLLAGDGRKAEPVPAREDVLERLLDARAQAEPGGEPLRDLAHRFQRFARPGAGFGDRLLRASSPEPPAAGRARRRRDRTRAPRPAWWDRSGRRRRGGRCRPRTAAPPRARWRCSRRRAAARRSRCRRARPPRRPRARRAGPRARPSERRAPAAARCRGRWRSTARRPARRRGSAARRGRCARRSLQNVVPPSMLRFHQLDPNPHEVRTNGDPMITPLRGRPLGRRAAPGPLNAPPSAGPLDQTSLRGQVRSATTTEKHRETTCLQELPEMEPTGIEPVTSCLQSRRSPS